MVARRHLLAAGITERMIERRLENGTMILEYPGVYRVGHAAPSAEATYTAAVLACGDGSGLSAMPAAWIWSLIRGKPPPPEVSAPTERRIAGLKTRRRRLERGECTIHRGIPITSVPLTLLDITPLLPPFELGKACHEAGVRYRTTPRMVDAVLKRRPNAPGAAKLRAVLEGEPVSLSRLESEFLALLLAHGLPLPVTNKNASGRRVDCRWPEHGLTVELDSYRFHNSRHTWEADRRRERQAYARGDRFRRYTWMDVVEDPGALLRELTALLASAAL